MREREREREAGRYRTIYADPPYPERGGGRVKRGADRHYNLMKVEEIIKLKWLIEGISEENCHLYLWVTNNYLKDGLRIMESWGFRYVTNLVWVKDRFGLGQYFRGQHELCLFGVKGKLPYKVIWSRRQQHPTVIFAQRKIHSQKPEEMYKVIETVSYPAYIELFARKLRRGWDAWGDGIMNSILTDKLFPWKDERGIWRTVGGGDER